MRTVKVLIILTISAICTVSAGIKSNHITYDRDQLKSIDIIFANDFETLVNTPTLTSETPFTGALPALETGHEEVGFTAGDFMVDQTGQAMYSIPIFAGVGTAGVAPKVSLQYSSAGDNGHLGVGWSIAGITLISRCRETAESKDVVGTLTPSPITYGVADKFCLNGERLFVSNGGTYGADGTEYRTEKEQFARITSIGGSGNNPDSFTVERKDGSISYYGDTTDSNITVSSSDVGINGKTYAWAISRYEDSLTNYIDYTYNKLANSEFVLTDIDYTGNVDQSLSPYNNLRFTYEARSDEFTSYLGGVAFDTTQRLAMIESRIDGTLVRDYTLAYATSSTSSRSILTSIQECRGNDCLRPTDFTWSEPDRQFRASNTGAGSFPDDIKSSKLGDVNGDGRADLVFVDESENRFKIGYAQGHSGFTLNTLTGIIAPGGDEIDNKWHLIDYNADGKQDLMRQSGGEWVIHLAQSSGFSGTPAPTGITAVSGGDFKVVDLNGDGLSDLLYPQAGLSVRYLQRVGSSYEFSDTLIGLALPINPSGIAGISTPTNFVRMSYSYYQDDGLNFYTPDVNGDGVADLILRTNVIYTVFPSSNSANEEEPAYEFISAGEAPRSAQGGGEPEDEIFSSNWVAFVNNGIDGTGRIDYKTENYLIGTATLGPNDTFIDDNYKFVDINADGLIDILNRFSTNNWRYSLGNAIGFEPYQSITAITNEDDLQIFDHDLDGYLDLVYPTNFTDNSYHFKRWAGNGFASNGVFTGAYAQNLNQNINLFIDFDGDGAVDHLRVDNSGIQKLYPRIDTYQGPDRITTFTNGLGASTEVLYRPLTFSSTYKQGDHATTALNYGLGSPVLDVMGAVYVVRQVDMDAPVEGDEAFQNTIRYAYENARIQTGGRGFLGFEKIITSTPVKAASDTDAKILESTTTYRQDFPYNGIPVSTTVRQLNEDFYATQNVPPVCSGDDCFPDPCLPGDICTIIPRLAGSSTLLSEVTNTVDSTNPTVKSTFAYIDSTETKTYDPDTGVLLKSVTQTSTHDTFGNPLTTTQVVKDGAGTTLQTDTVTNTYSNITTGGKWLIGLLETSSLTKNRTGQIPVTTETAFDYNSNNGLLIEERHHPNEGDDMFLRIKHEYDVYGNETKVISCSKDLTSNQCSNNTPQNADETNPDHVHRYNRLTYSNNGRYIDATYNTLEQKISDVITRDIYGNPLTTLDVLGRTTTNTYDVFGRLTSSRNTIGEWSQTSRSLCAGLTGDLACPAGKNAVIRIRELAAGGSVGYTYLDVLGREVASINRTFNATNDGSTTGDERWQKNEVFFDQFGRQVKAQGPYFLGSNDTPVTTTEYDRYSRPTKVTLPDNSTEQMSYDGLITSMTNGKGQRKQETKNALGQLTEVKDFDTAGSDPNYQNTLAYTYNSQGLVTHIRRTTFAFGLPLTELLSKSDYDIAGRKYSMDDVDSGLTTTLFNAEGEAIETQDAKGQILKNYHDTLGRVYQTESWDGNTLLTTSESQFNAVNGLLVSERKFLGTQNTPDYSLNHFYDAFNRASNTQVNFKDTVCGGLNCVYNARIYYDTHSRIKYQQDASSKAIQNHYSPQGYLEKITDATNGTKEYYQIRKTDKWGNISQDRRAGNDDLITNYTYNTDRGWLNVVSSSVQFYSYDFDVLGNLAKRADINNNVSECFFYDRLNRLTDTYRFNNFGQNCSNTTGHVDQDSYSYDGRGNITSKDGQSYSYNSANQNSIGASPHQIQFKGAMSFEYDANGNNTLTTGFTGGSGITTSRHIEYTAFDKIQRIYTGSSLNPFEESTYRYDTSEQRFSRTDTNADGETNVTHFIGNVEIEYNHNGQVAYKRQLGNYAVITEAKSSFSSSYISTQETYLFNDHLGSVDVITDEEGRVLQQMSFSAWGERRLPGSWQDMSLPTMRDYLSDYTTRGFTGHEMLDTFGIINMGGRIYDAALGKLLQADPFVQEPINSQSYNRYTYVFNNPLSYTDPSGFITLRQVVGIVAGVLLSFFNPFALNVFWSAFVAGFTGSIIITGNLKSAIKAGIIAGALAFAGDAVFGKGTPDTGDPGADVGGGAGDVSTTTASEATNQVSNNVSSASGNGIEQTAIQTGSASGSTVGETLSTITVTAPAVAGNLLADFAAGYWFEMALAAGTTAFLTNAANSIEQDALEFAEGSVSRTNFNQTALQIRDVARMANNILKDQATTRAVLSGIGTVVSVASMFTPIGFVRGAATNVLKKYSVGRYKDLAGKIAGYDAHHVGQKAVMKRFIQGYDPKTAPSILVPKHGHTLALKGKGVVSRSTQGFTNARQVIARDIMELRRVYSGIPNSALKQLIELNKKMYPILRVK